MKYELRKLPVRKISEFYHNVAKKYKHTYSLELMRKNISEAYDQMFLIEQTLQRRRPTVEKWEKKGYHMAHAGHWYYAYTINAETITITDACHEQNMRQTHIPF